MQAPKGENGFPFGDLFPTSSNTAGKTSMWVGTDLEYLSMPSVQQSHINDKNTGQSLDISRPEIPLKKETKNKRLWICLWHRKKKNGSKDPRILSGDLAS